MVQKTKMVKENPKIPQEKKKNFFRSIWELTWGDNWILSGSLLGLATMYSLFGWFEGSSGKYGLQTFFAVFGGLGGYLAKKVWKNKEEIKKIRPNWTAVGLFFIGFSLLLGFYGSSKEFRNFVYFRNCYYVNDLGVNPHTSKILGDHKKCRYGFLGSRWTWEGK